MSEPTRPVRRRRIAGESGPAAPAPAPAAAPRKPVLRRPTPKKAEPQKVEARTAPVATPGARTVTKPVATPVEKPAGTSETAVADERPRRPAPSRRDLRWLVPAALIALAALVAGIFLVVNPPSDEKAGLDASRRQASSAAATAAETIFTFRYDQLDQHLKASKALMTSGFAKEFDKIAPALTELAPQRNIVVKAVSRESAALPCGDECSASKVDVLVFVDQARLIGDSAEPTVFANRIKVTMVKQDDGWLVSDVRAL